MASPDSFPARLSAHSRLTGGLCQNDIPEDEWAVGLEFWAREYLKGEGELPCLAQDLARSGFLLDAELFTIHDRRLFIPGLLARPKEGV